MPRVKLFDENVVLEKAMDLFWKQGFAATSVQNLVSHLGINRASLYDTFGDKEKLFKRTLNHYRVTHLEGLSLFFQNHSNLKEGFSKLFENAIEDAILDQDRKGCFVVNITTELIPGDKEILDLLENNKNDFENLFYNYLKKGKESGQLNTTSDLKSLATLLFTLYNGIRVVAKIRPNRNELTNSINIAMSLLG